MAETLSTEQASDLLSMITEVMGENDLDPGDRKPLAELSRLLQQDEIPDTPEVRDAFVAAEAVLDKIEAGRN